MTDEGIHEIQLNGKQLVFLFMAATVVAVVVFLFGVMVGRGVRVPSGSSPPATTAGASDPTAPLDAAPGPVTTDGAPVSADEPLTYTARLEDSTPPPESLRDPEVEIPAAAAPKPPPVPEVARETPREPPPPPRPAPQPARETPAKPGLAPVDRVPVAAGEPAGKGFVVQVAAVRVRSEADTIARRLASKGYPSFVTTPGAGALNTYRVRVGKYPERKDAEAVAARLKKEEQFNTWITR